MKNYFKIYKVFVQNAISYESQYRGNTILSFFLNFLWIATLFITLETFFSHTESLGGWDKGEMYILLLFWMILDEVFIIFFNNNLQSLSDLVTEGSLDLYLTKPKNTLFLISTKYINVRASYRLIAYMILFAFTFSHFGLEVSLGNIVSTALLLFSGLVILYSFVLGINTLSFWFYRIENINQLWFGFTEIGKYPLSVLPKKLRPLFFTLIPVAFSAYFPAQAFFSKIEPLYLIIIPVFALMLFIGSTSLFSHALKNYTSASS